MTGFSLAEEIGVAAGPLPLLPPPVAHTDQVQHRADSIHEIAAREAIQTRRKLEAAGRAECGLWGGRWNPTVYQQDCADREHQHEGVDEQSQIGVQVSRDQLQTPHEYG